MTCFIHPCLAPEYKPIRSVAQTDPAVRRYVVGNAHTLRRMGVICIVGRGAPLLSVPLVRMLCKPMPMITSPIEASQGFRNPLHRDARELCGKQKTARQSRRPRQGFRPGHQGPLPAIASGRASKMMKIAATGGHLILRVWERAYPRSLPANSHAKDNSLEERAKNQV
jgi:hypothetical protein